MDPAAFSRSFPSQSYSFSSNGADFASTSADSFSYSPSLGRQPQPAAGTGIIWTADISGGPNGRANGNVNGNGVGAGGGDGHDSQDEGASEDEDSVPPLPGEVNGKAKGKKTDREIKRRSSKACDNCRKSKCKCNRPPLPDGSVPTTGPCQNCITNNVECTFNGASRKRGPPKGYIEAIESRLHRMEALLGNLLQSDDPRAQALLGELIGDNEAKEMLKKDLKAATEGAESGKGRKSWKLPPLPDVEGMLGRASGEGKGDFTTMRDISGNASDDEKPDTDDNRLARANSADDDRQRAQRRKLNSDTGSNEAAPNPLARPRSQRSNTIPHTGMATYTLPGSNMPLSPPADTSSGSAEPISELADVVGQLSLDENEQVRYHGRSSGLYLITGSQRFNQFLWHFPKPGVWPAAQSRRPKTEAEILESTQAAEALPNRETMDHLLELYWAFVHPVMPVLYKVEFLRAYRAMLVAPDIPASLLSNEGVAGGGKISMLLLLVMFSLAARYSDRESQPAPDEYWQAGDRYMHMAKKILNQDYASSKLPTCQALVLLAYREIGIGAMAESWLYTGMAIRMAQDMGLFRDVDKWFMPVTKFSYDVKQTRKRVWWACIILDKYVSTYIGRPMMIFERDYDTAFASHDEPDEHEQWRAIRPDGTDLATEPNVQVSTPSSDAQMWDPSAPRPAYPQQKSYAISCFNYTASLSVLISRIVANIYAIKIRVLGQSSETLLSLLDQNLANWYLELPEHLRWSPSSKKIPPPHVLTLHAQFYTALILLHRPFIPGQGGPREPSSFPSHSICTTAANAIATISTAYSRTFGLRQAAPFMVYYIFTAAILHTYNSTFEAGMAVTARRNLLRCMNGLEEMEATWPGARRARELLIGLVDLRDVDLTGTSASSPTGEDRGTKRSSDHVAEVVEGAAAAASVSASQPPVRPDFHHLPHFHTRGTARRGGSGRGGERSNSQRRNRSTSAAKPKASGSGSQPRPAPTSASPDHSAVPNPTFAPSKPPFLPSPPITAVPGFEAFAGRPPANSSSTYDIFGLTPPTHTQPLGSAPPAPAGATANTPAGPSFAEMMASFLAHNGTGQTPPRFDAPSPARTTGQSPLGVFDFSMPVISESLDIATGYDSSAFFGMPLSADAQAEDWQHYLPSAFFGGPSPGHDTGSSPGSGLGHGVNPAS